MRTSPLLFVIAVALFAGCASPKIAQKKTVDVDWQRLEFGGFYEPRGNNLSWNINGNAVMNGRFPPYTPVLYINVSYQGLAVRAECYFGSVLGGRAGVVGVVAGVVQSARKRAGDKCDMQVGGKVGESLYF